jgi:hypothetical protein
MRPTHVARQQCADGNIGGMRSLVSDDSTSNWRYDMDVERSATASDIARPARHCATKLDDILQEAGVCCQTLISSR